MLLLESGKMLPVSRLVEAVWDEDPPATAPTRFAKPSPICVGASPVAARPW